MRILTETSIAPNMASSSSSSLAQSAVQRSPWHSPVPYLFGGLAAMLGLIAFALLILACSYWKLSGSQQGESTDDGDVEKGSAEMAKVVRIYEEKIVVIMAGDEKPTYLATPVCSRGSSFNDENRKTENPEMEKKGSEKPHKPNKEVNSVDNEEHVSDSTSHQETTETQDQ